MKVLLPALLVVCIGCSCSFAAETKITPEFARQLLEWNKEDFEKEARLVDNALDNLNSHELRELLTLMNDDMVQGAGIFFSPPLPVEYRVGGRVRNNIKDRLGILEYNGVFEGKITRFDMPTTVYYCYFEPNCGPEFEMYIGGSALGPLGNVYDLEGQQIRVYVRRHPGTSPGERMSSLIKMELLADDPDANIDPQFASPGNPTRGARPR